jgi:hypothetical protein
LRFSSSQNCPIDTTSIKNIFMRKKKQKFDQMTSNSLSRKKQMQLIIEGRNDKDIYS